MTPAMLAAWVLGLSLVAFDGTQRLGWGFLHAPWMVTKFGGVIFLTVWHAFMGLSLRRFTEGRNQHSQRFWRATNELPFVAAVVIVLAATTKFGA